MTRTRLIKGLAATVAATLIAGVGWAQVALAAGGANLASGRPASASSTNAGFVAGNLSDGSQGSYWESSGALPQWGQVDLGSSTSIDQVVLKLPTGWGVRTETLSVLGSTDGSNFATLVASGGRVFDPATGNTVTLNFTAATARFVRVNITANTGWGAAQLSELEVYGTASATTNLAAGRPTTESGHADVYPSGNVVDGNQDTYWESVNNAFPQWVRIDLGTSQSINKVVLKIPSGWGARSETLAVQGSGNGTSFTDILGSAPYAFSGANIVTITFTSTSTRYVRIWVTANTGWPAGQLSEVEVYGPGGPSDTTPPSAPGTLSYTESGTSISLSWGASTDTGGSGLAGYDIYRDGGLAGSVGAGTTTFTDTQPTTATVSYFVRARDGAGNQSANSNTVTRTGIPNPDTTPPSVPGTLSFTQSGTTITLSWGASTDNAGGSGLAGYNVYRDGTLITPVLGNVTTFNDTQPTTATVSYFVRARDVAGNLSGNSNTVTRTGTPDPDVTPPSVPSNLAFTQSGTTITLTWGASTDGSGSGMAGYNVYRNGTLVTPVLGNVTTFNDTQPTTATVSYFVRGRDNAGNLSGNSNTVTRTGNPGSCSNAALNKPINATGSTSSFVPANAVDGNLTTYWEGSPTYPQDLTVTLGANYLITAVNVKLNPDPAWGTRTQNFQVLGRDQAASTYTNLVAAANYQFVQGNNVVNIPVSATAADVRLRFNSNTGAPSAQVAEVEVCGTPAPNPDLTVSNVTWSPASVNETTAVTLQATVTNSGTSAAPATTVNFTVNGTLKGTAAVVPLGIGASSPVTLAIGTLAQGSYTVGTVVDPSNTVIEQNDSNNSASAASSLMVSQAPGPDLQVLGIATNPANPAVGAAVSFTVAVNNRGTSPAAASVTRVTVGSTTLNTNTTTILAGQTLNVAITGTWTATAGGATITAIADATNVVAETNETNQTLTSSIVVGRGAAVPYSEYEAEAGSFQGTLLTPDALRTFGHTNFATESSGRKSVRLNTTGQFVQFTSTNPANSIVVRNSVPDSAGGGGQDYTISLYINDVFAQKLTLSSRNSWLYGTTDDTESLSNSPSADARRLFDESHALLSQSYPPGTRFKLQRDGGDSASFYIIDFIDLEQVAPQISQPAGCTSITTYGAVPNDGIDDSAAIQRAVTDDENGVISCVWIPAGQWRQEQKILSPDPTRGQFNQKGIRNAVIRGAGMWYTTLYTNTEPQNVVGNINHPQEGNVGFDIDENTQISDLAIFGMTTNRANRGHGINGRLGHNTKIANVWIEHVNVGAWVGRDFSDTPAYWNPGDGLDFTGMRIRNTYADGINFSNGTRNSRVFNSSFRTTGDDSLAVWANPRVKDTAVDVASNNHFINNTIQLPWRANGIAIYGGFGNTVENNLIYDTMNYPGIMLATDHDPLPFSGTTLVANNALYRCGGVFWNEDQEFGAITLFASGKDITGVTIRDTDIFDSTYDGIQFKTGGGSMPGVAITNVRIDKSNNGSGILAMSGARGSATLSGVTITNSRDGNILIEPGSQFTITGS